MYLIKLKLNRCKIISFKVNLNVKLIQSFFDIRICLDHMHQDFLDIIIINSYFLLLTLR